MPRKINKTAGRSSRSLGSGSGSSQSYPIYVVLENIRSLYNVGAMFRTADGAGVAKIFLCGITACPGRMEGLAGETRSMAGGARGSGSGACESTGREIAKTALGAEKSVEWEYEEEAIDVVRKLKKDGVEVVGVEIAPGAENYWEYEANFPIALIFGHETEGVSKEVLKACDKVVFVPMNGVKESLNVEAAFSTVVYEMVRKYSYEKVGKEKN